MKIKIQFVILPLQCKWFFQPMHLDLKHVPAVPINTYISNGTCYFKNQCEYCLIRGQIRKTHPSQDPGWEKAAMPSSSGTPGDHIREHLLSTCHVGAHIHSALHHPQPVFCLHWKPFWSGFHVVQKCTNAEGPFPVLPHSSAIHPQHFTAMGASGAAELGAGFTL